MQIRTLHGLGSHLTIDAFGCDKRKLMDLRFIYSFLDKMPEFIDMHKISRPYVVNFEGTLGQGGTDAGGVTGFVFLSESHIAIHTYPQEGYFALDIFSCQEFDIDKADGFIRRAFNPKRLVKQVLRRGLPLENEAMVQM